MRTTLGSAAARTAALGLAVLVALVLGLLTSAAPVLVVAGLLGLATVAFLSRHPVLAVGLLAGSTFFEARLTEGFGFLTPAKGIGALVAAAWALGWLTDRDGDRAIRTLPHFWWIALLGVWMLPSSAVAADLDAAIFTVARYVIFFMVFFLAAQVATDKDRVASLSGVVLIFAALASAFGIWLFLGGHVRLVGEPLGDPNDFGFMLATVLPLGVYLAGRPRWRVPALVASGTVALAILLTFSRGALVGIAVGVAWALATRRIPARLAVAGIVAVAALGAATVLQQPELIEDALFGKQAVAEANVSQRLIFWGVALEQFASSPVFGVGPGNFPLRYAEFALPQIMPGVVVPGVATHNTYLNILAELGLPGFLLFVGYLGYGWRTLRRRFPDDVDADRLQSALAASFVIALVGAVFLTQQFFLPLWLLPAMAAWHRPRRDRPRGGAPAAGRTPSRVGAA
jgi:putative inorganic carbon (hco3(-)) transporter